MTGGAGHRNINLQLTLQRVGTFHRFLEKSIGLETRVKTRVRFFDFLDSVGGRFDWVGLVKS